MLGPMGFVFLVLMAIAAAVQENGNKGFAIEFATVMLIFLLMGLGFVLYILHLAGS